VYWSGNTKLLSCVLSQAGILRFFGATEFASGTFAGVELDDPVGKNDGSLGGIRYFTCAPKHGRAMLGQIMAVCVCVCVCGMSMLYSGLFMQEYIFM